MYSNQLKLLVTPEVAVPGEFVEVVVKAELFTSVYFLLTSDLPVFEPKEQQIRKLIVGKLKVILKYLFTFEIFDIFTFKGS